jgi:hypothetical protein
VLWATLGKQYSPGLLRGYHPDLFAIIDERHAAERKLKRGSGFGLFIV